MLRVRNTGRKVRKRQRQCGVLCHLTGHCFTNEPGKAEQVLGSVWLLGTQDFSGKGARRNHTSGWSIAWRKGREISYSRPSCLSFRFGQVLSHRELTPRIGSRSGSQFPHSFVWYLIPVQSDGCPRPWSPPLTNVLEPYWIYSKCSVSISCSYGRNCPMVLVMGTGSWMASWVGSKSNAGPGLQPELQPAQGAQHRQKPW